MPRVSHSNAVPAPTSSRFDGGCAPQCSRLSLAAVTSTASRIIPTASVADDVGRDNFAGCLQGAGLTVKECPQPVADIALAGSRICSSPQLFHHGEASGSQDRLHEKKCDGKTPFSIAEEKIPGGTPAALSATMSSLAYSSLSPNLGKLIGTSMLDQNVLAADLSAPDFRGIRWHTQNPNRCYLALPEGFLALSQVRNDNDAFVIRNQTMRYVAR